MKSAVEKLAEVKSENELASLGWVKGKCSKCDKGLISVDVGILSTIIDCPCCKGTGTDWVKVEVGE